MNWGGGSFGGGATLNSHEYSLVEVSNPDPPNSVLVEKKCRVKCMVLCISNVYMYTLKDSYSNITNKCTHVWQCGQQQQQQQQQQPPQHTILLLPNHSGEFSWPHLWHAGHTTHQQNLVDILGLDTCVLQGVEVMGSS